MHNAPRAFDAIVGSSDLVGSRAPASASSRFHHISIMSCVLQLQCDSKCGVELFNLTAAQTRSPPLVLRETRCGTANRLNAGFKRSDGKY